MISLSYLIIISFFILCFGKNSEIPPNILGVSSRACATAYCPNLDGLGLWMKIQPICYNDTSMPSPSSKASKRYLTHARTPKDFNPKKYYTPHQAGIICAFASLMGLFAGYYFGLSHSDHEFSNNISQEYTVVRGYEVYESIDDGDRIPLTQSDRYHSL